MKGELPPNLASGERRTECRDVPDNAYFDGRIAEMAVETLSELERSDDPFFLAVGFWKPHTPFNAPKKYWDLYQREAIPLPENLSPPENVPELALTKSRFSGKKEPEALREMHHGHLAAISYLDAQVGKVIDQLDRLGLRDQTVIVFWSDHGLHIGEHGLLNKTTNFELDARVPLIIDSPMHPGGKRCRALVELLDLFPTLVDLAGIDPMPKHLEGRSLLPLLQDPDSPWSLVAMTQAPRPNYLRGKKPEVMGYSVRTERYRYTEWRDFEGGEVLSSELYDHRFDPGETNNLAGEPSLQNVVEKAARLLEDTISKG